MKATVEFKQVIFNYLKEKANSDPAFAVAFAKEGKNMDDCVNYILNTVKASGYNGFDDAEIYGMAIHYYDEDDIKPGKPVSGTVVINHHLEGKTKDKTAPKAPVKVKLTQAEIESAKEKAMQDVYQKQLDSLKKKRSKSVAEQPIQQSLF
ncbi:PcfK-like protein [Arachidicoccus rhizosphaerae]|uniref:PcfK-like protein n=1 Tax=Arachidicoccus rhizosphaerae TaxID=551991 RepID=A0A1H4CGF2_9BACT|nr:PcfK-like family protein [Arachidicoccus rhizosphaerae]SEA59457.1 PcfK-like protein [Arachidicoccus rhizosphaerae]